jgi:hypothetical protein
MKQQNYSNHRMYYAPHHFIFLPLMGVLMTAGIVMAYKNETDRTIWIMFSILSFCILYLAVMLRQHYALGNQDRIIRLEFRLRYFELKGKPATAIEKQLSFGQIAALRFADDHEFDQLLANALNGHSPDQLKKAIKSWQADDMRL